LSPELLKGKRAVVQMIKTDEDNLVLAESTGYVDELNAQFYGRFPYPWRPAEFNYLLDPDFETVMLNQDLGDWQHRTIPRQPKIWVAGCGTNQAVWTALRFPNAKVLGSDLSRQSLEVAGRSARELKLINLELRNESINQVDYVEQFDYVICTGVIHHNAEPQAALKKLAGTLKPNGILELMVYNRCHRIITTAFQTAIRTLSGNKSASGFELELTLVKRMIESFPIQNAVSMLLHEHKDSPEAALADDLLQPVEQSYTVESLNSMANDCDLEILTPCINRYDRARRTFSWNMEFGDTLVQEYFDVLPDISRWQVANLLLLDKSPLLWFYLQRGDSGRARKSEREICEEFLDTTFIRSSTQQGRYIPGADGVYEPLSGTVEFPRTPSNQVMRRIVDLADGVTSMRQIFRRLDIEPAFQKVNQARVELTTSTSPYLRAVKDDKVEKLDASKARQLKEASAQKIKSIRRKNVISQ
jgi:SAM-dependent methyltransferase